MHNLVTRWLCAGVRRAVLPVVRAPDVAIGKGDDIYMRRWFLVPRNRRLNIYLHNVLRSDDARALHDHPWWSLSFALAGQMTEIDANGARPISAGTVRLRSSTCAHRLADPAPGTWTLFLTGPVVRSWGFHCPQGWRGHKAFIAARKDGQGSVGCGEPEDAA